MEINLTTPALLFPAISLILLAYTNRFLGIATVVRNLSRDYRQRPLPSLLGQIRQLRYRLILIRNMQAFGAASALSSLNFWVEPLQVHANFATNSKPQPQFFALTRH